MCLIQSLRCKKTQLGEKQASLLLLVVGWESATESNDGYWGIKSTWTTQHKGINYVFCTCIYISVLHTTYLYTDVSSTVVIINRNTKKSAHPSQTCKTIAEPDHVADGEIQYCVGVHYCHMNVIQSQRPIFTQLAELQKVCTKVEVWHFETE